MFSCEGYHFVKNNCFKESGDTASQRNGPVIAGLSSISFLKIGTMRAVFHCSGTKFEERNRLNRTCKGNKKQLIDFTRNMEGLPSGVLYVFVSFYNRPLKCHYTIFQSLALESVERKV